MLIWKDFFYENVPVPTLDVITGLHYAIVISANEENIYLRTYKINISKNQASTKQQNDDEDDENSNKILQNIGPNINFTIRRENWATDDVFKVATKQPKVIKKKEDKNVSHNTIGDKMGRIYVDKQNIKALALKKRRKLKIQQKKEEQINNIQSQAQIDI